MHDDQINESDSSDALIQQILAKDNLLFHEVLGDKDIRDAITTELRDIGVPAPGIVYRLFVFAFGGCERFLSGSIKSRLKAYIGKTPAIAGMLQKILNLQHGAKEQAELKSSLLDSLKDGKPIKPDITPNEASSLEMMVSLHTAKQLDELDDHINKLGDEVIEGFRDDLAEQFNQLVAPELAWHEEIVSPEKLTAFQQLMYTSGMDPFLGREDDIDLLHRFAGDPSFGGRVFNFRWMLLTGDSGDGKTRLAYEFTRKRLNDLWYKGKLDFANLKDFVNPSKWRPVKPTFIVIDYVQSVPKEVYALLLAFSTKAASYEFPVRLLLLERNANANWTDKLLPESGSKSIIEQHNFGGQSVLGEEIKPLFPDVIVELMKRRIQKAHLDAPEPSKLLSLAKSVDHRETSVEVNGMTKPVPTPRPLFAIATAEAIIDAIRMEHELPVHFERTAVLEGIVKRDRDMIWSKAINSEGELRRYEMGLAVATLAQGVSLHDLNGVNFGGATAWLPPLPPDHDSALLAAFGYSDKRWPPMEPDILGEYFVSEQLLNSSLTRDHRIALMEGALLLGEGQAVSTFWRMARDFPKRFKQLQLENVARVTLHEKVLRRLTVLVGNVIGDFSDFDIALRILDAVFERKHWNRSSKHGVEIAAVGFNVSTRAAETGDWVHVVEMRAKFDALRKAFPMDQEIALEDAKATFNISHYAGKAGDRDRVAETLARFDALRKSFPMNQEIAQIEAEATYNISHFAGKAGDWTHGVEMLARVDALRKAFPMNHKIARQEAAAAVSITGFAGKAGDWAHVVEMLARVDALRKAFPMNQEIAREEAKAAVSISDFAGKTGHWVHIVEMLAKVDTLRKAFPMNQEIARDEAKVAVNISAYAEMAGDRVRFVEMLAKFDALRKTFPMDQDIAREETKAAHNISSLAANTNLHMR